MRFHLKKMEFIRLRVNIFIILIEAASPGSYGVALADH